MPHDVGSPTGQSSMNQFLSNQIDCGLLQSIGRSTKIAMLASTPIPLRCPTFMGLGDLAEMNRAEFCGGSNS